jgi:hypothetical protein
MYVCMYVWSISWAPALRTRPPQDARQYFLLVTSHIGPILAYLAPISTWRDSAEGAYLAPISQWQS